MTGFLLALALLAQTPAVSPAPSPPPAGTDYTVGAGDVLDITVIGNDDLTRTPTVQTNGTITLPLLEEVGVSGLTVLEIRRKLTTLLERDFLVNPQVEVRVREFQSQSVIVLGEVNSPGRKVLRGRTRLVDLLIDAGGFRPTASGDVVITRSEGTFESGKDQVRITIGSGSAMSPQDRVNLELPLKNGDLINVAARQQVTIEGEVARPGRFPIEADSTITALISVAGGLTRYGNDKVKLRRIDGKTGRAQILEIDLGQIRSGKKPEVRLEPNDVITVTRRKF